MATSPGADSSEGTKKADVIPTKDSISVIRISGIDWVDPQLSMLGENMISLLIECLSHHIGAIVPGPNHQGAVISLHLSFFTFLSTHSPFMSHHPLSYFHNLFFHNSL